MTPTDQTAPTTRPFWLDSPVFPDFLSDLADAGGTLPASHVGGIWSLLLHKLFPHTDGLVVRPNVVLPHGSSIDLLLVHISEESREVPVLAVAVSGSTPNSSVAWEAGGGRVLQDLEDVARSMGVGEVYGLLAAGRECRFWHRKGDRVEPVRSTATSAFKGLDLAEDSARIVEHLEKVGRLAARGG